MRNFCEKWAVTLVIQLTPRQTTGRNSSQCCSVLKASMQTVENQQEPALHSILRYMSCYHGVFPGSCACIARYIDALGVGTLAKMTSTFKKQGKSHSKTLEWV